jgi:peroxiredoxin
MRQQIPEVGDLAPDFQTKTSAGETFNLQSALEEGHHIMLVFYRGHW